MMRSRELTWLAATLLTCAVLAIGVAPASAQLRGKRVDPGSVFHADAVPAVVDTTVPPPPPPPPPGPGQSSLLTLSTTEPWEPIPSQPMTLIVGGWAPFACPLVTAATVLDTTHLALTLSPGSGCSDNAASWMYRFALGYQRAGHHPMDLAITVVGDTAGTYHFPVLYLVYEDSIGGGPPPPGDSLEHVLSPSRPNPFVTESRFSVSLDKGTDADVSVFDVNGRRMSTVFHGRLGSGSTELSWNGRRADGMRAAAGVYFYRLTMGGRVIARRLVLLRQ